MSAADFAGFPAVSRSTVVPNLYLSTILPDVEDPAELLAFLWASHVVQAGTGDVRFTTEADIWSLAAARRSFERIGGGRTGLLRGLEACAAAGALISVRVRGDAGEEDLYFVNNPGSRRAVARARAGEISLRPRGSVLEPARPARPGVFRLYEEHIGTITPFVGERLLAAADRYPPEQLEAAFREAAELNVRNWRYVERMLERWETEGREDGEARGDSLEERKRRFLAPRAPGRGG